MKELIKVLMIEDHPGFREVITRTLDSSNDIHLLNQFGTAEIALRELRTIANKEEVDVILLDLNLPGMSGLDAIPFILEYTPDAKIIILTQSNREEDVIQALSLGALGYLLKSATAAGIKDAIKTVAHGGATIDPSVAKYILNILPKKPFISAQSLSSREHEILSLLGDGMLKKEIADHLDIAVTTVASHIKHIYRKLDVQNAPAAVAKGYKSGLLE